MNTPTLLELENKANEAKKLCYNNAIELHKINELKEFCEELITTVRDILFCNGTPLDILTEYSSLAIFDYLGTVNKEYQEIFKDNNCFVWGAFSKIKDNLYNKENPAPSNYLQAFYSGNFVKCFELFDKF